MNHDYSSYQLSSFKYFVIFFFAVLVFVICLGFGYFFGSGFGSFPRCQKHFDVLTVVDFWYKLCAKALLRKICKVSSSARF